MKAQLKFEKIICLVCIIAGAVAFVMALGLCTDIYKLKDAWDNGIEYADIFEKIQPFNSALVIADILLIVISTTLFITKTNSRRNYYITNYVATGVVAVAFIGVSIWAISQISSWTAYFNQIDFEELEAMAQMPLYQSMGFTYTDSTLFLTINMVVYFLEIVVALLLVANLIWKIMIMKYEKDVLAGVYKAGEVEFYE